MMALCIAAFTVYIRVCLLLKKSTLNVANVHLQNLGCSYVTYVHNSELHFLVINRICVV